MPDIKEFNFYHGGKPISSLVLSGREIWSDRVVEVIPFEDGQAPYKARDWLIRTLKKYGKSVSTVEEIPFEIDSSNVTNMYGMFLSFSALKKAPRLDCSAVTNTRSMFQGCSSLESVPDLDVSNVTNCYYMFMDCASLKDGAVRLIRRDKTVIPNRDGMLQGSGLTREPFFAPDGTPIPRVNFRGEFELGVLYRVGDTVKVSGHLRTSDNGTYQALMEHVSNEYDYPWNSSWRWKKVLDGGGNPV